MTLLPDYVILLTFVPFIIHYFTCSNLVIWSFVISVLIVEMEFIIGPYCSSNFQQNNKTVLQLKLNVLIRFMALLLVMSGVLMGKLM